MSSHQPPANTGSAALVALDETATLRMLGWLSGVIAFGAITPADWEAAYAHAADDQTVRAARADLAMAVA